jgi:MtN3 and saliva related transmembrane protein
MDALMTAAADWLGYVAACLTTVAFVPQAWLTWRTRRVDGVSSGMYALFTAGVACWLAYGIALGSLPIILANAVTLILAAFILLMKLRAGMDKKGPPRMNAGLGQSGR